METVANAKPESLWTRPFTLLMLLSFLGYGGFYLTLPVLPAYIKDLGGTETQTGMILGIFSASALLMRPWSGWIADRFGTKVSLLLGLAAIGLAAAAYIPAHSVGLILVIRILHGVGWGMFSAAAATLAAQLAPVKRRGAAIGIYGVAGSTGLAIGPVIGTALGPTAACFAVSTAATLCGIALAAMLPGVKPESTGKRPTFGSLVNRSALLPGSIVMIHMATYGALMAFVSLMVTERGLGNSGWFFSTYASALFFFRGISGQLSDKYGRIQVIFPGLLLGAVALTGLALSYSLPMLVISSIAYAGAMSALQPVALAWAADRAGGTSHGSAISTVVAAQDLGISTGSSLAGMVAQWAGLKAVFLAFAGWELLGAIPAALVWRRTVSAVAQTDERAVK